MTPPDRSLPIRSAILALVLSAGAAPGQDASAPLRSDPSFEALATDGSTVTGRIRSIDPDGRVDLVEEDGTERVIEAGSLVKLSRVDRSPARDVPDTSVLVLPGGDQLRGLIDMADEQAVVLRSTVAGELTIPLEAVLGFTIGPPRDAEADAETIATLRDESRTSDLLLLENGDRLCAVTFSSLTGAEVAYLDSDRALRLPRETVRAVGLDPGLVRTPEIEGRSFDVILTDGSRLRLFGPSAAEGRLSGGTAFGLEIGIGHDRIADLYDIGGSVAYLSDLEATREVTVPYVGPTRPSRPDASVLDGPLTVGGRRFARGLGTQSRSLLAYRIGPDDRRFQATVAPDDAAGPLGNVVFRVLVDGEERFASPPMSVGDDPLPVDVDVQGAQFLILATEFGRGGGVRDYAAWLEARFIRDRDVEEGAPRPLDAGN